MLRDRYQNNFMILRAHVNANTVQKPLTLEAAKDLRHFFETIEEHPSPGKNWTTSQLTRRFSSLSQQKNCQENTKILRTLNSWNRTANLRRPREVSRCQALEAATLSAPPTSTSTQPRFTTSQNSQPSQSS